MSTTYKTYGEMKVENGYAYCPQCSNRVTAHGQYGSLCKNCNIEFVSDKLYKKLVKPTRKHNSKANDRFGFGGCYKCENCGKLTRDTGHEEVSHSFKYCRSCYESMLNELDD